MVQSNVVIEYTISLNNHPLLFKTQGILVKMADDNYIVSFSYKYDNKIYHVSINYNKDDILINTKANDYITQICFSENKAYMDVNIDSFIAKYQLKLISYNIDNGFYLEYEYDNGYSKNNNKIELKYIEG